VVGLFGELLGGVGGFVIGAAIGPTPASQILRAMSGSKKVFGAVFSALAAFSVLDLAMWRLRHKGSAARWSAMTGEIGRVFRKSILTRAVGRFRS